MPRLRSCQNLFRMVSGVILCSIPSTSRYRKSLNENGRSSSFTMCAMRCIMALSTSLILGGLHIRCHRHPRCHQDLISLSISMMIQFPFCRRGCLCWRRCRSCCCWRPELQHFDFRFFRIIGLRYH